MPRLTIEGETSTEATPINSRFQQFIESLPKEWQSSAHNYVDEIAYFLWQERGGQISSCEEQTADKLKAEEIFVGRYGPKSCGNTNH